MRAWGHADFPGGGAVVDGVTVARVGSWSVADASGNSRTVRRAFGADLVGLMRRDIAHDIAIAVLAAFVGVIGQPSASLGVELWTYWGIVAGCSVMLVVRSRLPRTCLAALAVLMMLHQLVLPQPSAFAAAVCVIAAYTTQTCLAPPWRWSYLALTYLGTAVAILFSAQERLGSLWPNRVAIIAAAWAFITIAALAGAIRSRNHSRMELAMERAAFLESHYELAQRLAAAEERTRIAREMHDILGHSLSAIAVQAEGAKCLIRSDVARAERALADIGRLSRAAVEEAHELFTVLRTDDRTVPGSAESLQGHGSTHTLNDLDALVRSYPSDQAIRLRRDGDVASVPRKVSVAGYRLIQEALTNAIRHTGQVPTTIQVSVGSGEVRLLVSNATAVSSAESKSPTEGHGIAGMRERVAALGGCIEVGPDAATGDWRVSASLPWRTT